MRNTVSTLFICSFTLLCSRVQAQNPPAGYPTRYFQPPATAPVELLGNIQPVYGYPPPAPPAFLGQPPYQSASDPAPLEPQFGPTAVQIADGPPDATGEFLSPPPAEEYLQEPSTQNDLASGHSLPWIVPYQTRLTGSWIAGTGDDVGISQFDVQQTWVVPSWRGLSITPNYGMHFLSGPDQTDIPGTLYNASLSVGYRTQLSERWGINVAVSPGIYSDFEIDNGDAIRIQGRGLASYTFSPATQVMFGVVYLDREDIQILPAAGLVHSFYDDLRLELVFPKPRLVARLFQPVSGPEYWGYIGGELGGGSWAIEREDGSADVITYRDLRLITGVEIKRSKQKLVFFEVGFLFNREFEFESGIGDFDAPETVMLRAGAAF